MNTEHTDGWNTEAKLRFEDPKNPMYVDFTDEVYLECQSLGHPDNLKRYLVQARIIKSKFYKSFGLMRLVKGEKSFYERKTNTFEDEECWVNFQGVTPLGQKCVYNSWNWRGDGTT